MIFRARNSGGRHAARRAPAAPTLVAPAHIPPVTPGGWARLTGSIPAALIELTDTHAHLLAGILLNAGDEFRNADSAPECAAEQYVRHLEGEITRLRGQQRWTKKLGPVVACDHPDHVAGRLISEPKTGRPALTARQQQEQAAAYRHAIDPAEDAPDAAGQNCPTCGHPWAWHVSGGGCNADGVMCECEQAAPPTAEERM